jgi:hypothetical protein
MRAVFVLGGGGDIVAHTPILDPHNTGMLMDIRNYYKSNSNNVVIYNYYLSCSFHLGNTKNVVVTLHHRMRMGKLCIDYAYHVHACTVESRNFAPPPFAHKPPPLHFWLKFLYIGSFVVHIILKPPPFSDRY